MAVDEHHPSTIPEAAALRPLLSPGWAQLRADEHAVQFYDDDEYLIAAVTEFIGSALRAGDAGVVLATPAHRVAVERRLRSGGIDIDAGRRDGRYQSLDAVQTLARFIVDGRPERERFMQVARDLMGGATRGGCVTSSSRSPRTS